MANIAHNISAFNDLVGAASMEITLHKRQEILSVKEETESGFVKFLKKTKGWVDEKIVHKFKEAPDHLKPVIKLALKDATMLVAACLLGKITSESDDANYSATKEQFVDLVVLNTEFKEEFEGALITGETNTSDVAIIIDKKKTGVLNTGETNTSDVAIIIDKKKTGALNTGETNTSDVAIIIDKKKTGALYTGETNTSDVAIIIDKKKTGCTFCQVFSVHDIIYNNPYIELLRFELPIFQFLEYDKPE